MENHCQVGVWWECLGGDDEKKVGGEGGKLGVEKLEKRVRDLVEDRSNGM